MANNKYNYFFKLKEDWSEYKKGDLFDSFDGLVSGIADKDNNKINFDNKKYFDVIKVKIEK